MSDKVHRLTPAGPVLQPDAAILARLRDLAARAERGEIKGIGLFWIDGGDTIVAGWDSGCADSSRMVAGAAVLSHRITRTHIDD